MSVRVHIMRDCVNIDHWFYNKPSLQPNKEGNIILIFQYSMGPLEWWEWRVDAQGKFWMEYKWCENDFYEDANFKKEISKDEMLRKIQYMKSFFGEYGLQEFVEVYQEIEEFMKGI